MQVFACAGANTRSMYMVVSHWKPTAGNYEEFESLGRQAREFMRGLDGVEFISSFRSGEKYVVVHLYRDAEAYARIVEAEDGPFAAKMKELNIEGRAEWLGSERGETLD